MAADPSLVDMGLPPEYQAQLDQANRQRAIAQALLQSSMKDDLPQQIGPVAAKLSPLSILAKAGAGYFANAADQKGMQQQTDVRTKFSADQAAELAKIMSLPQDQRASAAMQSRFPMGQQYGKFLNDRDLKLREPLVKVLGEGGDLGGASRIASGAPLDGNYTPPTRPEPTFSSIPGATGPIPTVTNSDKFGVRTGHLGTAQNINVDLAGQSAAAKAVGGKVPDIAESSRQAILDSLDKIRVSNQIYNLAQDPQLISGFGANYNLGLTALGNKLGLNGSDAVAKTQEMLSLMAKQTLAASTQLKGAISDKEGPFLAAASSGQIQYTPQAIAHLAQLAAAVEHNRIAVSMKQWQGATSQPGGEGAASMWPMPSIEHRLPGKEADYGIDPNKPAKWDVAVPGVDPAVVSPKSTTALTPAQLAHAEKLRAWIAADPKTRGPLPTLGQ